MDKIPVEVLAVRRGPFSGVEPDPELKTALGLLREEQRAVSLGETLTATTQERLSDQRQREYEAIEYLTPGQAHPYAVRVAWRLCVAVGLSRGFLSPGQSLRDGLGYPGEKRPKCPWETRHIAIPTKRGLQFLRDTPTPLLPRFSEPETWLRQLEYVCQARGVRAGSRFLPFEGFWGLRYLWEDARKHFPTPDEIFQWDALLIEDAKRILKEGSKKTLENHLQDYYGLVSEEVTYLYKAASACLIDEDEIPREAKEALLVARLEAILDEELDHKTRLRVIESLAKIQGIGSLKREDSLLGDLVDEASQL